MRFEVHRVLDSQVADVPGRRRIEVVMGVLVERMMSGKVPDRSVHRRRPNVDMILEELGQGPPRSAFNLDVRNFRRQVLEGLRQGIEELDIRERGVDERAVGGQDWLQGREIRDVQRDTGPTIAGKNSCEPVRDRFHGCGVRIVQSVEGPADVGP